MLKRTSALVGAILLVTACGSSKPAPDEKPDGAPDLVAECNQAANKARASIAASAEAKPTTAQQFRSIYEEWRSDADGWDVEDHVCLQEGSGVMDRLATHKEIAREFDAADDALQTRLATQFAERDDAAAFFDILFAGGDKPPADARRAAFGVASAESTALYEAFSEHGWGMLDADGATTCMTSGDPFSPQEDVRDQGLKLFENEIDIHVFCRLPVDAESFAGDENGNIRIELSTGDWNQDPVTAVDLGKPEKWGKTRSFTARFRLPLQSSRDAETYHANLIVRRPNLGDEKVVGTTFWWFR